MRKIAFGGLFGLALACLAVSAQAKDGDQILAVTASTDNIVARTHISNPSEADAGIHHISDVRNAECRVPAFGGQTCSVSWEQNPAFFRGASLCYAPTATLREFLVGRDRLKETSSRMPCVPIGADGSVSLRIEAGAVDNGPSGLLIVRNLKIIAYADKEDFTIVREVQLAGR